MYIVKHKPDGRYFKRGTSRSRYNSELVDKQHATVFRSKSGILNCLGDGISNLKRENNHHIRPFFIKKLCDIWEIEEVKLI